MALAHALEAPPKSRQRKPPAPKPLTPFTLDHFRWWVKDRELTFDNGAPVVLVPFQEAFLADVFAGFAEAWLLLPEGNGKTTLLALLALYHAEFHENASVPIAASSRDQAEIMYRQAEGFVLRSERMHEEVHSALQVAKGKKKTRVPRFTCLEGYRRVNHVSGGRIQVFAADDRTGDGVIPTLGIIDEMHRHRDMGLYRTWSGKLRKRHGQLLTISTAGEPGSEFEETRTRIRTTAAEIVRKGSFVRAVSARLVLHEWAVPADGDFEDMAVVKAANPFPDVTVESLGEKFSSPTMTISHWKRLTCNIPTREDQAAIQEVEWSDAKAPDPIPAGQPVMVGFDVAWKWDTTAIVPLWVGPKFKQAGFSEILVPPRDGTMLSPELVKAALRKIHKRNRIKTVVMDMTDARDIASWLVSEFGCLVIDHPQSSAQQFDDYDAFMEGLRTGQLKHSGEAGLTKHVLNAIAKDVNGRTKFERPSQTRQAAQQERRVIDALDALAFVNRVASLPQPKARPKLYVGAA